MTTSRLMTPVTTSRRGPPMDDPFESREVPDPRPGDDIAQVMTVCTANIARSPLAMVLVEDQARQRLGPDAPVWVSSSGVNGLVDEAAVGESRALAERRGLDLSTHRARQSTAEDVASSDLVIAMTERHRDVLVGLHPAANGWVFTLVELARLMDALLPIRTGLPPRQQLRAAVRVAHASRLRVPRPSDREDVKDPFGRPVEAYEVMGTQLDDLVGRVAPQLFGFLPGES